MSSEQELDDGIQSIKSAWRREHTARANLEKMLEQAEAENAKLREELEQWHQLTAGIELPEYPITEFKPKDLERENAKLRELVRDMWFWHYCGHIDSEPQEKQMKHIDGVLDRMRELEVDG